MNWYKKSQSTEYDQAYFNRVRQESHIQALNIEIKNLETDVDKLHQELEIPAHTCSIIDAIQKIISESGKEASAIQKEDESGLRDIHSMAWDIETELDSAYSQLEDVRNANHQLRELGRSWYLHCQSIIEKIQELADSVSD